MDILKARKKAAEKKHSGKKTKHALPLVEQPIQEAPPAVKEAAPGPTTPVVETVAFSVPLPSAETAKAESVSAASTEEPQEPEIELLSFQLGAETYAVPVADVREVLKNRLLTPVPNAPDHILGVTSLRGTVLPVIDLCPRLGVVPGPRDEKSRIVVINAEEEPVGLSVDRVTGVVHILSDEIKPTPEHIEQGAAFLLGIVRKDDKLFILLDLAKALAVNVG